MRILVTGSRAWSDGDAIEQAILNQAAGYMATTTIVHGGALGADAIASRIARRLGLEEEVHVSDWRPHGVYNPQAGLVRNAKMVSLGADVCLAFIKDGSAGASDCARKAEAAGIRTLRFEA